MKYSSALGPHFWRWGGVAVATGTALVLLAQVLPYAILPGGGVRGDPTAWLSLLVFGLGSWLATLRADVRFLALLAGSALLAADAYLLIAALRAVPTWTAVNFAADGAVGPASFVAAFGLLLIAAGLLLRVVKRPAS